MDIKNIKKGKIEKGRLGTFEYSASQMSKEDLIRSLKTAQIKITEAYMNGHITRKMMERESASIQSKLKKAGYKYEPEKEYPY